MISNYMLSYDFISDQILDTSYLSKDEKTRDTFIISDQILIKYVDVAWFSNKFLNNSIMQSSNKLKEKYI